MFPVFESIGGAELPHIDTGFVELLTYAGDVVGKVSHP